MLRQLRKNYRSSRVNLVDMQMLPLDFGPRTAFVGEVSDCSNWDFVFDSLTVRRTNCTKEQHPSFALTALFFIYPACLMFSHHSVRPCANQMLLLAILDTA